MAVNGIEIAVGQRWRRRDGSERVIDSRGSSDAVYRWSDVEGGATYTDEGLFYVAKQHPYDLVELVVTGDSTQATTFSLLPDADGWIDWHGGECPVDGQTFVEYRTRRGEEGKFKAFGLSWALDGAHDDIVAYRIISDAVVAASVTAAGRAALSEIVEQMEAAGIPVAQPDPGRTNPKDLIGDKKLALHLLSPIAEAHWVVGQYAGMLKYGAWNWREAGVRASVYISAARRHLAAYLSGEEFDPTDGSHHLGNVMACCAILLEAREIGKLTDDRPPCFSHRPAYAWAEDRMAQLKVQYADKTPKHYSIADRPAVERKKADDTEGGAL